MKQMNFVKKMLTISVMLTMTANVLAQYDWTGKIKNPSFENGTTGWTLQKTSSGWDDTGVISGGVDGSKCYNIWSQKVSTINLYQTITLPAGNYTLSAQINTTEAGLNNQHVYAITDEGSTISKLTEAGSFKKVSLDFTIKKEGSVTIGAASTGDGATAKGWFQADDFRLSGDQEMVEDIYQSTPQVTTPMKLTSDSELTITGTAPFAVTGSVEFVGTEHSYIYFPSLRPTVVKTWLGFIKIKGEDAVAEQNCQLRLYDHGTMLLPYGKESKATNGFHPLTVYSEQNCQGESCELFGIENTEGYMNTIPNDKLNNRIRSFRLKRGYMVTFSLQPEGYGYQRCFIAADQDLVVNALPEIMDRRISSYRIFRFNNIGKNGVADFGTGGLAMTNSTWTYNWGAGKDFGMDYEYVPHMNHLWSTSTYSLGANDRSPYLKTDNEPANSHDPSPATVEQELRRWQDLMRIGRRLLSPSSVDGGQGWHTQFFDSIDARGWRCDVVDVHSYWVESGFNSLNGNWYNKYKRPIWITEFIWGCSWSGGKGIFAVATTNDERNNPSDATLQKNREVLTRIWNNLNKWGYVERYAYWNFERACSKIVLNNQLTPAGEQYAAMKTGVSYHSQYDFIPRDWRLEASKDLKATYDANTGTSSLSWQPHNGDLTETMTLQRQLGVGEWKTVYEWTRPDELNMSFVDTLSASGVFNYRVKEVTYKNTTHYSNIATICVSSAEGTDELQYGRIHNNNIDPITVACANQNDKRRPLVFMGMPSNKNSSVGLINHLKSVTASNFTCFFEPWNNPENPEMTQVESMDFIAVKPGHYKMGNITMEVDTCVYLNGSGKISKMSRGDTIHVDFKVSFDDGIVPVVLVQPQALTNAAPVVAKVFDVTNEGFNMKLMKQAGEEKNITNQYTYYIAATPGFANLDEEGKSIYVGKSGETVGGLVNVACKFTNEKGERVYLNNPYIIAGAQTHNLDFASTFRQVNNVYSIQTDEHGNKFNASSGIYVRRQMDTSLTALEIGKNSASTNGDVIGWIIINDAPMPIDATGIESTREDVANSESNIFYDLSGRRVMNPQRGIYILNGKKIFIK